MKILTGYSWFRIIVMLDLYEDSNSLTFCVMSKILEAGRFQ
jgi:hypothetical protein